MLKKHSIIQIIYTLIITALLVILTYAFLQTTFFETVFTPNAPLIFKIMLYYLLFIFFRVAIHLFLSFFDYLFTIRLPEPQYFPLTTILIPCYNEEIGISSAISSALAIQYPNVEILVIDDGSLDKTLDIAIEQSKLHKQVRVIHQENKGKSHALNYGISQASGEYVLCMDADSIISPNVLHMAIKYFLNFPKLAAIAGSIQIAKSYSLLSLFQSLEYIIGLNFFKSAQSLFSIVPIVPGPLGVFKKQCLLEVNGYRSDNFAEDADLSMRLLMAGHDIKYCAGMKAITEAPDTIFQLYTQRYRWNRGMIQAIMDNIRSFVSVKKKFRALIILTYMFIETIAIPLINFIFALTTLQFALLHPQIIILGPYFIGLTVLDLVLSLYSIVMEKQFGILFLLSLVNRLTYGLMLETIRFFSLVDELFNIPMKWGSIKRKGIT